MVDTTKHIFVTGGVASSLGKGLTASSLGRLLRSRGLRVTMQKLDPYINVDPGTMNPFQHGEVFVTDDGAETDLDIGHYERFLDVNLVGSANVTTGQVYNNVIAKERRGEYLGDTVQVIPHITNEIVARMRALATGGPDAPDVIITEIGGTVGDIESLPFLEAARQVRHLIGRDNSFFLHVSLVPYLAPSGELKTKPTQHSRRRPAPGRHPARRPRAARRPRDPRPDQAQDLAHVRRRRRPRSPPAVDAPSIYDIPKVLHREGLDAYVIRRLGLNFRDVDWTEWDELLERVHDPEHDIEIALVGKYIDLPDAYLSVTEALRAGGFHHDAKVNIRWVASDECQTPAGAQKALGGVDAVLVPGGFGVRGIEGKLGALTLGPREAGADPRHLPRPAVHGHRVRPQRPRQRRTRARRSSTPRPSTPSSRRWRSRRPSSRAPATSAARCASASTRPPSRRAASSVGPTARPRSRSATATATRSTTPTGPTSRRRVSSSPAPRPTATLVEFVELPREVHPYYVSTQAHPEFLSRPNRAHPLFAGLVGAALERQRSERLVEVERHRAAVDAGQAERDADGTDRARRARLGLRVAAPPRTPTEPRVSLDAPRGTGSRPRRGVDRRAGGRVDDARSRGSSSTSCASASTSAPGVS